MFRGEKGDGKNRKKTRKVTYKEEKGRKNIPKHFKYVEGGIRKVSTYLKKNYWVTCGDP